MYRVVQDHLLTFYDEVARESDGSGEVPRYVREEFDGFLRCGILQDGLARVVCKACRFEHVVAHSCKGRGICPSYSARRMTAIAAKLCDEVLPQVPYRQWTLSFPQFLRPRLAATPKLISNVLTQFFRLVFAWQRRKAKALAWISGLVLK